MPPDPDDPWERVRRSASGWRGSWLPGPRGPSETTDDAPARPPLGWPHVVVVAAVGLVALAATAVVLLASRPSSQAVPLTVSTTPAAVSGAAWAPGTPLADPPGEAATPAVSPAVEPAAATQAPPVVVHVAGRVRRPGVVVLPAGSRVVDAIEAAGGARPRASLDSVNLARVLTDGEQVRVGLPDGPVAAAATPGAPVPGAVPGPLDLNTASASDLDGLPGIGPVLAERIVAFREQNGPFTSVDQLLDVSGIGPAVLADLQGQVRV